MKISEIRKIVNCLFPTINGLSKVNYPENEILGVPQRSYGYLTTKIKDKYKIDKLQTTNIRTCTGIMGINKNGSFLSHIDECVDKEVPCMMDKLTKILGDEFNFFIFCNHNYSEQKYLPKVIEFLKKYSLNIEKYEKSLIQEWRIGISLDGKIFHPENCIKNDSLYKDENALFMDIPESCVKYRTSLGCINEMEGIL